MSDKFGNGPRSWGEAMARAAAYQSKSVAKRVAAQRAARDNEKNAQPKPEKK